MVCSTSRTSVFLARHAVAPNPIIWRHSAGVGLLASTISRTPGKPACRSRSSDGLDSEADVCRHQAQVRIAVDQRLQPTVDNVLELRDSDVDRLTGGDAQLRRVWV